MAVRRIETLDTKKGLSFEVRARPSAGRSGIAGEQGGALKVELKSPPEGGKANRELVKLIAKMFGAPASDVEVVSGESSRRKRIRITGIRKEIADEILTEAAGK
jgi:uncharacterized protein